MGIVDNWNWIEGILLFITAGFICQGFQYLVISSKYRDKFGNIEDREDQKLKNSDEYEKYIRNTKCWVYFIVANIMGLAFNVIGAKINLLILFTIPIINFILCRYIIFDLKKYFNNKENILQDSIPHYIIHKHYTRVVIGLLINIVGMIILCLYYL